MFQVFNIKLASKIGVSRAIIAQIIYDKGPSLKSEIDALAPYFSHRSTVVFLQDLEKEHYIFAEQNGGLDRTKTYFCTEKLNNIYKED